MVTRRRFLEGLGLVGMGLFVPRRASATTAIAATLRELVVNSQHVFVGTSMDAFSRWERVGARSRIVTYSVVRVDRPLDGRPPDTSEVMVRTLGGVVGDRGQVVHGEAVVALGEPAALFIHPLAADVFSVTRMAQGHYPLEADSRGEMRLRAAIQDLELVDVPEAAVRQLHGRSVDEAATAVAAELAASAR